MSAVLATDGDGAEFAVDLEGLPDAWPELQHLLCEHWMEIGGCDGFPLEPDIQSLESLIAQGVVHLVTARHRLDLVGCHLSLLRPHLFARRALGSHVILHHVNDHYRSGNLPAILLAEAERTLAARGVCMVIEPLLPSVSALAPRSYYEPVRSLVRKMLTTPAACGV